MQERSQGETQKHVQPGSSLQKTVEEGSSTRALPVTDVQHADFNRLMNPGTEKRQSMKGFDDDYVDIVDYIVRCTHKIWEEKGLGLIYSHYRHNVVIHTTDGMTYGRDKVIADSAKMLSAFPDSRLFADDVIWSGDDEQGFHSSHRITWVGRNTGYSIYGPPTGRKIIRQGIAHCFVKENRVVEEWICRDELSLVRQLGFDEHALARKMAAQDAARGLGGPRPVAQGEVERLLGQGTPEVLPPVQDGDLEGFVRRALHEVWNWRLLNKVDAYYARNYVAKVSTNRQLYGWGDYKAFVLGMLAVFPDAMLSVDHVCAIGNETDGFRVATRWTLTGTHDGLGVYGEPTGKRVYLMGITHHEIRDGKFVREWTLFDEFALLKQLYAPEQAEMVSRAAPL